ncbi:MAG TPA: hypothetical protein VNT54_19480, partial [Solirubrobacteraceae bacterium]|nr:hypothetical protein [Solirubrobacteraceae bacterium]
VINAEGEYQAAEKLSEAAVVIGQNPAGLQLRYLQTLGDLGVNQNTTVVFPVPMKLMKAFGQSTDGNSRAAARPA